MRRGWIGKKPLNHALGDAMKLYAGITDADWFRYLRERNAEEMNFWHPRATTKFKILEQNELFYSNLSIQKV